MDLKGVTTKRQLLLHVFNMGSSPALANKPEFTNICLEWIKSKFPEAEEQSRKLFVTNFVERAMKEYQSSDTVTLLTAKKHRAFLDEVIQFGSEFGGTPPEENIFDPSTIQPLKGITFPMKTKMSKKSTPKKMDNKMVLIRPNNSATSQGVTENQTLPSLRINYLESQAARDFRNVKLVSMEGPIFELNSILLAAASQLLCEILQQDNTDSNLECHTVITNITKGDLVLFCEFVSFGTLSTTSIEPGTKSSFLNLGVDLEELSFSCVYQNKPTQDIKSFVCSPKLYKCPKCSFSTNSFELFESGCPACDVKQPLMIVDHKYKDEDEISCIKREICIESTNDERLIYEDDEDSKLLNSIAVNVHKRKSEERIEQNVDGPGGTKCKDSNFPNEDSGPLKGGYSEQKKPSVLLSQEHLSKKQLNNRIDSLILENEKIQAVNPFKKRKKHEPWAPKDAPKYVMCQHCGKSLRNTRIIVERHYETHSEPKQDFKCVECGKFHVSKSKLKDHIEGVHEKTTCDQCGTVVKRAKLLMHIHNYHTPEEKKKFRCECTPDCSKDCKLHCNPVKGFFNKAAFKDHLNLHLGIKPHTCNMGCSNVSFAHHSNLAAHVRTFHKGIKRKK